MKRRVLHCFVLMVIVLMLIPNTAFAAATGAGDSNQDSGTGLKGRPNSGLTNFVDGYLTAFRMTIVDSNGKRVKGTHSTDFYNKKDYNKAIKLAKVNCSAKKRARNEVVTSTNMVLCGTQTANKINSTANVVHDTRIGDLPKIFLRNSEKKGTNSKEYVKKEILPQINKMIKGDDLTKLNAFFKERFNYEYSSECTKKEHFILVEPITYTVNEKGQYYLGTATELENVIGKASSGWWAATGVAVYYNFPYSLYIQTENGSSYFDETEYKKFTGFHPLPTNCRITSGHYSGSATRSIRCIDGTTDKFSHLMNGQFKRNEETKMFAHSMGLINIAEELKCNDIACSSVIKKAGLGNEIEKSGVLWEKRANDPGVSAFTQSSLDNLSKAEAEKWIRDNISVCYDRAKLNCGTVTVDDFRNNNGTPNLGKGVYTKQTYINISSANADWGKYYLQACPKITCEDYDGSKPINSDDNNKFDKNKFNSLPTEAAKEHYVENCPCYCDDYTNDLYNIGCNLPANPPGGKYESDIASNLDDNAYKEYISHCPPCRPCDPDVEVCDSSCNLASACPSPDSETGVTGSIKQGNIIDRQACADSANVTEVASSAIESGFIEEVGSPYCKAACTYDINELTYPGAKIGLGSGRFIRFDEISIKINTTCTTSQIDYDKAQTDLNNATSESAKNTVINNINKCLNLSTIKRPKPIIDFKYQERNDHAGFDIATTQSNTSYTYCRQRLNDNRCYDVASGPQAMAQTIVSGSNLERTNNSTTVVFTDRYQYRPKTVYYSTFYEAKILKDSVGAAAATAGKAIKIGDDGRVFPINFNTAPGKYEYSVLTDLNHKTLKDLQKKYAKTGHCSLDYTCFYKVHKYECDEPCPDTPDLTYEPGINASFRFVSNNDINPNNRTLGTNWQDAKGIDTINEIQDLGDEVYADENLEYSFTLTPSIMNKIRGLNDDAEDSGGYANDTLTCTIIDSNTGYYICKSDWLKELFTNNTYQIKDDDKLFTSYVDGTPWK